MLFGFLSYVLYTEFKLFPYNSSQMEKSFNLLRPRQISIAIEYPFSSVCEMLCTRVLKSTISSIIMEKDWELWVFFCPSVLICKPKSSQRDSEHFVSRETAASTGNILLLLSKIIKEKQNTNKHVSVQLSEFYFSLFFR